MRTGERPTVGGSLTSFSGAVTVTCARPDSEELVAVRALWRDHSDALGFFPDGAFAQHAERGWVLVAKESADAVVGYLLYRVSRGRAVIVHLCIDDARCGLGIARQLFRVFRDLTSAAGLLGARLTCRTDFLASGLWPRLGFVQVGDRRARQEGKRLGLWAMDYGYADLFSASTAEGTAAVMDANVFYDIVSPGEESHRSAQARALCADWLQSSFTLAVTPELNTEISRNPVGAEQRRLRTAAAGFAEVKARPQDVDDALAEVEKILGPGESDRDRSDRRHLAFAIASQSAFFLTCDGELLDHSDALENAHGIRVLRPVDLINVVDETDHPLAYDPARLEGSGLNTRQVRTEDLDELKRVLVYFDQAETLAGLPGILRDMLAQPRTASVRLVADSNDAYIAAIGIDHQDTAHHSIRVLRVARHRVSATLARHLLWRAINDAVRLDAGLVTFEDPFTDERIKDALAATGFVRDGEYWVKLLVKGCVVKESVDERVGLSGAATSVSKPLRDVLLNALAHVDMSKSSTVVRVEHLLWPLKVRTEALPCYIVPIRPAFAAALFDTAMAAEFLFSANSDLLLRLENVYYRSPQPMLRAPARVLWYVSGKGAGSRAKHVSAASTLTEVVVDTPKSLYSRFRRFGIYEYRDVKRIADRAKDGRAMAFTFAQTEVFEHAIPLDRAREVLRRHSGRENPLMSPVLITSDAWFDLYAIGAPDRA